MNRILLRVVGGINALLSCLGIFAFLLAFTVDGTVEQGDTQAIKIAFLYLIIAWLVAAAFCFKEPYRSNDRFRMIVFHMNLYPILLISGLMIYERIAWSGHSSFLTMHMVNMVLFFAPFITLHGLNMYICSNKFLRKG
jgi:hypothetical protein